MLAPQIKTLRDRFEGNNHLEPLPDIVSEALREFGVAFDKRDVTSEKGLPHIIIQALIRERVIAAARQISDPFLSEGIAKIAPVGIDLLGGLVEVTPRVCHQAGVNNPADLAREIVSNPAFLDDIQALSHANGWIGATIRENLEEYEFLTRRAKLHRPAYLIENHLGMGPDAQSLSFKPDFFADLLMKMHLASPYMAPDERAKRGCPASRVSFNRSTLLGDLSKWCIDQYLKFWDFQIHPSAWSVIIEEGYGIYAWEFPLDSALYETPTNFQGDLRGAFVEIQLISS